MIYVLLLQIFQYLKPRKKQIFLGCMDIYMQGWPVLEAFYDSFL